MVVEFFLFALNVCGGIYPVEEFWKYQECLDYAVECRASAPSLWEHSDESGWEENCYENLPYHLYPKGNCDEGCIDET